MNSESPVRMYLLPNARRSRSDRQAAEQTRAMDSGRRRFQRELLQHPFTLEFIGRQLRQLRQGTIGLHDLCHVCDRDQLGRREVVEQLIPCERSTAEVVATCRRKLDGLPAPDALPTLRRAARLVESIRVRQRVFEVCFQEATELNDTLAQALERLFAANHLGTDHPARRRLREELSEWMHRALSGPWELDERVRAAAAPLRQYQQARACLAEDHLWLVALIAKRYRNRGVGFLDLIQEGNLGLLRAAERFDADRNLSFSTYAKWWIREAILRALAHQRGPLIVPQYQWKLVSRMITTSDQLAHQQLRPPSVAQIARALGMPMAHVDELMRFVRPAASLDRPVSTGEMAIRDLLPDPSASSPGSRLDRESWEVRLAAALNSLAERERRVISLRYGLEDAQFRTFREVSESLGVSIQRVQQIHGRAIIKLRRQLSEW